MTLIVKAMRIGFTESSNATVIIDEYLLRIMNITDGKYLFIIIILLLYSLHRPVFVF